LMSILTSSMRSTRKTRGNSSGSLRYLKIVASLMHYRRPERIMISLVMVIAGTLLLLGLPAGLPAAVSRRTTNRKKA